MQWEGRKQRVRNRGRKEDGRRSDKGKVGKEGETSKGWIKEVTGKKERKMGRKKGERKRETGAGRQVR